MPGPRLATRLVATSPEHERLALEAAGPFGTLRSTGLVELSPPDRIAGPMLRPAHGVVELLVGSAVELTLLGLPAVSRPVAALPPGISPRRRRVTRRCGGRRPRGGGRHLGLDPIRWRRGAAPRCAAGCRGCAFRRPTPPSGSSAPRSPRRSASSTSTRTTIGRRTSKRCSRNRARRPSSSGARRCACPRSGPAGRWPSCTPVSRAGRT